MFQKPFPFPVAVNSSNPRGDILVALLDMPAANEPTIRKWWRVECDEKQFFSKIN